MTNPDTPAPIVPDDTLIKSATLTVSLKADSGYTAKETHRVSPVVWGQIVALANGEPATAPTGNMALVEAWERGRNAPDTFPKDCPRCHGEGEFNTGMQTVGGHDIFDDCDCRRPPVNPYTSLSAAPPPDLVAENARLVEALKPFATFAEARNFDKLSDNMPMTLGSRLAHRQVTAGDFKRARAALSQTVTKEGGE
jgi:hypothetical protein